MRIISGSHRGRVIRAPEIKGVRPTTDFARTGLFNLLRSRLDLQGITAIDLFCGIGAVTCELLSRGAGHVMAVDANGRCVRFVKKTVMALGFENVTVEKSDAEKFMWNAPGKAALVFADPPYDYPEYHALVEAVFSGGGLEEDGWFVLEHGPRTGFGEHPNFVFQRQYGHAAFSFMRVPSPDTP